MASYCPKCRRVLEEDEVCCAQIRYVWRCKQCRKVTTGFAIPYGNCFLCGGAVEEITDRRIDEPMRYHAIREAMQFELNAYHFYRLALDRATNPEYRVVLDYMSQNELDHIHELEEKYHAHLDPEVLTLTPAADELLADQMLAGLDLDTVDGMRGLYARAIEMEKRTGAHFEAVAAGSEGMERELYLELAAEEQEHVALLETELRHLDGGSGSSPTRSYLGA